MKPQPTNTLETRKPTKNQQILLSSRPRGEPSQDNFQLAESEIPKPGPGQMLLGTIYLSLDPYMQGRMKAGPSYAPPLEIGEVMGGQSVCEVVESNLPNYHPGDIVLAATGWQEFSLSNGEETQKIDRSLRPISYALGALGMPGFTAYAGLLNIGRPQSGKTIVVAAASGAVGSVVGQIAKIKGCRDVGIALARLPDSTIADLEKAHLFDILVPKMYGGLQCSPRTFMDAVVELGRGDGSAAWALAIVSASTWMAATLYSKQVVDEIFSGGNFRTAGALAPRKSKTKRVDDGVLIEEGSWSFKLFSSAVPARRLLDANLGRSDWVMMNDIRAFGLPDQSDRRAHARRLARPKLTAELRRKSCDDINHRLLRRTRRMCFEWHASCSRYRSTIQGDAHGYR